LSISSFYKSSFTGSPRSLWAFFLLKFLEITSEYFSTGLGWPLALVIAGLAMIGVGYMSLSLKKKYLTS